MKQLALSRLYLLIHLFQDFLLLLGSIVAFFVLVSSLFGNHWLDHRSTWEVSQAILEKTNPFSNFTLTATVQIKAQSFSGLWEICCGESRSYFNIISLTGQQFAAVKFVICKELGVIVPDFCLKTYHNHCQIAEKRCKAARRQSRNASALSEKMKKSIIYFCASGHALKEFEPVSTDCEMEALIIIPPQTMKQ